MDTEHGTIHWNEFNTHKMDVAKAYFAEVHGWEFDDMPMEDGTSYGLARAGEKVVAGIFDMSNMEGMEKLPSHWMTYFAVNDVDATAAKTEELGGCVIRAPFDVEGVGRFAILQDPSGGVHGAITPVVQPASG